MDGVGDDNYFRDFFFITGLVKTVSNCEEFRFSASNKDCIVSYLIRGLSCIWICETKVAMLCLMLASDTTSAIYDNKEDIIVMSSSCWDLAVSFFTLLERLNENWSWKMFMTLEPGVSSGSREEKNGRFHVTCCISLQGDLWWNFSSDQWVNW